MQIKPFGILNTVKHSTHDGHFFVKEFKKLKWLILDCLGLVDNDRIDAFIKSLPFLVCLLLGRQ